MEFIQVAVGVVDGVRDDFGDHVVRQQAEVAALQVLVGEDFVVVAVEFLLDVGLLLGVGPFDVDVAEAELGQAAAVHHAPQADVLRALAPPDASLDGVHQAHGAVVADVVQFLEAVEVQQADVVVLEGHDDACRVGDGIVRLLHDHVLELAHEVAFLGLAGVGGHHAADDDVRVEVLLHDVGGEVVVDAAVVGQHAVYLDGLEHEGEAHRGPDGIAQVAFAHDEGLLVVHVRRNAAEGDEQVVEVAPAGSRGLHEHQVHLDGVHQIGGDDLRLGVQGVAEGKADAGKLGCGPVLLEVVFVLRLHLARVPPLEVWRTEQGFHVVGRIAHGIERTDDGAHGGTGDVVDGDVVLFQRTDDADVGHALGTATAQHEPHFLGTDNGRQAAEDAQQEQQDVSHTVTVTQVNECPNINKCFQIPSIRRRKNHYFR